MGAQSTVLTVKRQNYGSDTTTGKFFATGTCSITGREVYLQHDGSLRSTCSNGWFGSMGELGSALQKFHTQF